MACRRRKSKEQIFHPKQARSATPSIHRYHYRFRGTQPARNSCIKTADQLLARCPIPMNYSATAPTALESAAPAVLSRRLVAELC